MNRVIDTHINKYCNTQECQKLETKGSQGGHKDVNGMITKVSKGKVPSRYVHEKEEGGILEGLFQPKNKMWTH